MQVMRLCALCAHVFQGGGGVMGLAPLPLDDFLNGSPAKDPNSNAYLALLLVARCPCCRFCCSPALRSRPPSSTQLQATPDGPLTVME